jgi:predicted DsbA family dithiol-disulfide isomerase
MLSAVKDGRYVPRLISARKEGQLINLTGVPTFIIEGKYKVVGAQPLEVFHDLLDKIEGEKS